MHCDWLKIGKKERCGKRCKQFYCKTHSEYINKGGKIPLPCLCCGVGVMSSNQLCTGCEKNMELNINEIKQARRQYITKWVEDENRLLSKEKAKRKNVDLFQCKRETCFILVRKTRRIKPFLIYQKRF